MNSFLESASTPNLTSSSFIKLTEFNRKHLNKSRFKPLTSFDIERVRLKYLDAKHNETNKEDYYYVRPKEKQTNVILPKIDSNCAQKLVRKKEPKQENGLGAILIDFSRHSLASFVDVQKGNKKNLITNKNLRTSSSFNSLVSNTSTTIGNDSFSDKNYTVSIENFSNIPKKSKDSADKFGYNLDDDSNSNHDLKTQYRLKSLKTNNAIEVKKEKVEVKKKTVKKLKKKSENRKNKLKESVYNESNSINTSFYDMQLIRVDSPHTLKKSIPNDYKFVSHSSVCIGVTSKELADQFVSYQSNFYSNEKNSD